MKKTSMLKPFHACITSTKDVSKVGSLEAEHAQYANGTSQKKPTHLLSWKLLLKAKKVKTL
jgi:hypothetical protein